MEGWRDFLSVTPGVGAWGLVTGVAMVQSGLTVVQATGFSALAFAGSAQLATAPLIVAGVPVWVIFLTALAVNLRFVIYSAIVRDDLRAVPWRQRLLLGYLTSDTGFALYVRRLRRDPDWAHRTEYFIGLAFANAAVWQVTTLLGIVAASWFPREWGLELAGTLALLALWIPLCATRSGKIGSLAAVVVGVATFHWPLRLGLLAAILVGSVAAVVSERLQAKAAEAAR
jgi:predicted branched-subunit amino acid permease